MWLARSPPAVWGSEECLRVQRMCWRGWFQGRRKRTKDTENLCLAAETNTVPKIFLFQRVSLFIYSFLYSIICSFKICLLSICSEPRTMLGTGKSNSKATCPQRQGFWPRMFCSHRSTVRSSCTPQFSPDIQQNSVCLRLKAQTCGLFFLIQV